MNRNKLFFATTAAAEAVYTACTVIFCIRITDISAGGSVSAAAVHIIAAALFAAAGLIAAVCCLAGKMKNEKSIVYSVSRLFMIVFCYNTGSWCKAMYIALAVMAAMYFLSLKKDFRIFSSRNSKGAGK